MDVSRHQARRHARCLALAAAAGLTLAGCGSATPRPASTEVTGSPTASVSAGGPCIHEVGAGKVRAGYQGLIYETRYGSSLGSAALRRCWQGAQVPTRGGIPQQKQMELVHAPGSSSDPNRPSSTVMRVELAPYGTSNGDEETLTGTYRASRAEVFARQAPTGTRPADWPDPVNSTRWYSYSVFLPRGFAFSSAVRQWFIFTQWKGIAASGSPAIALGVRKHAFVLDHKLAATRLGRAVTGRWTTFLIGMHFSSDATKGWVSVALDGHTVVPVTHLPTMNRTYDHALGGFIPNPTYLKQGIYRSDSWRQTQTIYIGPIKIGTSAAAVTG